MPEEIAKGLMGVSGEVLKEVAEDPALMADIGLQKKLHQVILRDALDALIGKPEKASNDVVLIPIEFA